MARWAGEVSGCCVNGLIIKRISVPRKRWTEPSHHNSADDSGDDRMADMFGTYDGSLDSVPAPGTAPAAPV